MGAVEPGGPGRQRLAADRAEQDTMIQDVPSEVGYAKVPTDNSNEAMSQLFVTFLYIRI
jgi:hypothetical protein